MMNEEHHDLPEDQEERSQYNMKYDNAAANELFNKHFLISDNVEDAQSSEKTEYVLPKPECMFKEEPWQNDNLQILKNELNSVKSCLNDFNLYEWQQHTYEMNQASDVLHFIKMQMQPEFATQAWCKFYEIACNFSLVPLNKISQENSDKDVGSFTSVHLCEAPGAFVTALNHWLKVNARNVQWDWIASTLNPYCEGNPYNQMVDDDRFIRHTLPHWCFGTDNTGNIMDLRNLDNLVERLRTNGGGPIMLVTADGSIDCTDMPDEQENSVAHLHFCETVACLHLLEKGGNFLLKMFTLFEHQSVCLMYLLSCAFQKVTATKPATSKGGNSETYVVCVNYKGRDYIAPYLNVLRCHYNTYPTRAMFSRQVIPDNFMRKIEDCCNFFKHHQCKVIENNIKAYTEDYVEKHNMKICYKGRKELTEFKQKIVFLYLTRYKLEKIDPGDHLVGQETIERNTSYIITRKLRYDSYNERCRKQDSTLHESLRQIWCKARGISMPSKSSYTWNLRALPKIIEIQMGKKCHGIYSSRFCEAKILQILNEVNNVIKDMHSVASFPSMEITETRVQVFDQHYDSLNFQLTHVYDSHRLIVKICDRLGRLQIGQTLVFIDYPLLTQLNVGLLYILGSSFERIRIEVHANKGYHVILKTYRCYEALHHLRTILTASYNALDENMAIWSVVPIMLLYEWDQFPVIIELNHMAIKVHTYRVLDTLGKT